MINEIGDAILLLQNAKTLPPAEAAASVDKVIQMLIAALRDHQAPDPDAGG